MFRFMTAITLTLLCVTGGRADPPTQSVLLHPDCGCGGMGRCKCGPDCQCLSRVEPVAMVKECCAERLTAESTKEGWTMCGANEAVHSPTGWHYDWTTGKCFYPVSQEPPPPVNGYAWPTYNPRAHILPQLRGCSS